MRHPHYKAGYGLFEVIAVSLMIGVLALLSARTLGRPQSQLTDVSRLISDDLLWTRSEAQRLARPLQVHFDSERSRYRVYADESQTLLSRDLRERFPEVVLSVTFPEARLSFGADGLPRSADGSRAAGDISLQTRANPSQLVTDSVTLAVAYGGRVKALEPRARVSDVYGQAPETLEVTKEVTAQLGPDSLPEETEADEPRQPDPTGTSSDADARPGEAALGSQLGVLVTAEDALNE